jgi:HK97 family phage prohead protease
MNKETKTLHFSIAAKGVTTSDDGQEFGQIECYGAIFGNVDDGGDRINKGAFTRTIQNSKARAKNRDNKYILPILWQHDTNELIGGWYELKEDDTGLLCKGEIALATQRGREYYALAKAGMSDQFSIIYDIPSGGAKYDKSGVRDLTELRLFSIDVVTFAMNSDTRLVGVKSMDFEYKSVCGSTSGPIGPRDESWDGASAKSWIWSKALDDEGNVKPAVAKRYFMRVDGDPKLKGSYGYPFWTHDHISVGGVKACANALAGARNADAGGDSAGMKRKVERLYSRINGKYPDAEPLVPPWKDGDGKSVASSYEQKDLSDHFQDHMAEDLCEDWQDVYLCSLTCAVLDAIKDGSDPETDVAKALDDFKSVVMSKFVSQAMDYDLAGYLEDNPGSSQYLMSYGNDSRPNYGYMSRNQRLTRKELLAADATTGGFYASDGTATGGHAAKLHQAAEKAMKAITEHVEQLHTAADEVTTLLGGPDQLTPTEKRALPLKAGRSFSAVNAQALSDHADSLHDMADTHKRAMMRHMKAIRTVADDLADVLQGSEAAYGTDEGTPTEGRQEGKSTGTSYAHTRANVSRSSTAQDTVNEEEITASLQKLKALRVTA